MKRLALLVLAGLAVGVPTAPPAWAQDFPTRQITLIAPWPAGGAVDAICRALAQPLSERLGKSVVVENRPGAGSVIGTAAGAKAAPDGYTMVMAGSGSLAISATMYKKLPYDPVKDFIPLTMGAKIPFVLVVNPSLPVHSPAELVAYAKANPGKLSFASGGPGSPHHLYGELLKSMTGIEMTHVPYKGSAPALTDVIAGHVPLLFSDTVPSLPQIREGKVRALGVSTAVRLPSAPEIPPIAEGGVPGFDAAGLGRVLGAGRHAEGGGEQAASRAQRRPGIARGSAADHQARHDPGRAVLAGGIAALHQRRDRTLGQGRAAGRPGRDGVIGTAGVGWAKRSVPTRICFTSRKIFAWAQRLAPANIQVAPALAPLAHPDAASVRRDHKNRVGHISVRHMCDDGVLSRPRPSFGCLKLRPMMSTKSSRSTLALGSNE